MSAASARLQPAPNSLLRAAAFTAQRPTATAGRPSPASHPCWHRRECRRPSSRPGCDGPAQRCDHPIDDPETTAKAEGTRNLHLRARSNALDGCHHNGLIADGALNLNNSDRAEISRFLPLLPLPTTSVGISTTATTRIASGSRKQRAPAKPGSHPAISTHRPHRRLTPSDGGCHAHRRSSAGLAAGTQCRAPRAP